MILLMHVQLTLSMKLIVVSEINGNINVRVTYIFTDIIDRFRN
jgi:hypothetical protein